MGPKKVVSFFSGASKSSWNAPVQQKHRGHGQALARKRGLGEREQVAAKRQRSAPQHQTNNGGAGKALCISELHAQYSGYFDEYKRVVASLSDPASFTKIANHNSFKPFEMYEQEKGRQVLKHVEGFLPTNPDPLRTAEHKSGVTYDSITPPQSATDIYTPTKGKLPSSAASAPKVPQASSSSSSSSSSSLSVSVASGTSNAQQDVGNKEQKKPEGKQEAVVKPTGRHDCMSYDSLCAWAKKLKGVRQVVSFDAKTDRLTITTVGPYGKPTRATTNPSKDEHAYKALYPDGWQTRETATKWRLEIAAQKHHNTFTFRLAHIENHQNILWLNGTTPRGYNVALQLDGFRPFFFLTRARLPNSTDKQHLDNLEKPISDDEAKDVALSIMNRLVEASPHLLAEFIDGAATATNTQVQPQRRTYISTQSAKLLLERKVVHAQAGIRRGILARSASVVKVSLANWALFSAVRLAIAEQKVGLPWKATMHHEEWTQVDMFFAETSLPAALPKDGRGCQYMLDIEVPAGPQGNWILPSAFDQLHRELWKKDVLALQNRADLQPQCSPNRHDAFVFSSASSAPFAQSLSSSSSSSSSFVSSFRLESALDAENPANHGLKSELRTPRHMFHLVGRMQWNDPIYHQETQVSGHAPMVQAVFDIETIEAKSVDHQEMFMHKIPYPSDYKEEPGDGPKRPFYTQSPIPKYAKHAARQLQAQGKPTFQFDVKPSSNFLPTFAAAPAPAALSLPGGNQLSTSAPAKTRGQGQKVDQKDERMDPVDEKKKPQTLKREVMTPLGPLFSLFADDKYSAKDVGGKVEKKKEAVFDERTGLQATLNRFPVATNPRDRVAVIVTHLLCSGDREPFLKIVWALHGSTDELKPSDFADAWVLFFNDEREMLTHWARLLAHWNIFWLTGFNSIEYDLPYIMRRMTQTKARAGVRYLSRFYEFPWDSAVTPRSGGLGAKLGPVIFEEKVPPEKESKKGPSVEQLARIQERANRESAQRRNLPYLRPKGAAGARDVDSDDDDDDSEDDDDDGAESNGHNSGKKSKKRVAWCVHTPGLLQFDVLVLVKSMYNNLDMYTLKYLAQYFKLKVGKDDVEGHLISPYFAAGGTFFRLLLKYCDTDVMVTWKLLLERAPMTNCMELATLTYTSVPQQMLQGQDIKVYNGSLQYAQSKNFLMDKTRRRQLQAEADVHLIEDPFPAWLSSHVARTYAKRDGGLAALKQVVPAVYRKALAMTRGFKSGRLDYNNRTKTASVDGVPILSTEEDGDTGGGAEADVDDVFDFDLVDTDTDIDYGPQIPCQSEADSEATEQPDGANATHDDKEEDVEDGELSPEEEYTLAEQRVEEENALQEAADDAIGKIQGKGKDGVAQAEAGSIKKLRWMKLRQVRKKKPARQKHFEGAIVQPPIKGICGVRASEYFKQHQDRRHLMPRWLQEKAAMASDSGSSAESAETKDNAAKTNKDQPMPAVPALPIPPPLPRAAQNQSQPKPKPSATDTGGKATMDDEKIEQEDLDYWMWKLVAVVDYSSLYPSLIRSRQLCPMTQLLVRYSKVARTVWFPDLEESPEMIDPVTRKIVAKPGWKPAYDKYYLWDPHDPKPTDELVGDRVLVCLIEIDAKWSTTTTATGKEKRKMVFPARSCAFAQNRGSLLPDFLAKLLALRKEVQLAMKTTPYGTPKYDTLNSRQAAVKVVCNSAYGVVGAVFGRNSCMCVAMATTACGRIDITETARVAKRRGYKVVYGDTDSLFLEKEHYYETADGRALNLMVAEVEDFCAEMTEHRLIKPMKLEFEKMTTRNTFFEKKKYLGFYLTSEKAGEALTKGMENVRRDICSVAREMLSKIMKLMLQPKARADCKTMLQPMYEAIRRMADPNVPATLLQRTVSKKDATVSDKTPQFTVFNHMAAAGEHVEVGTRVPYVFVMPDNRGWADDDKIYKFAMPVTMAMRQNKRIHRRWYVEKHVLAPLQRLWRFDDHLLGWLNVIGNEALRVITHQDEKLQDISTFLAPRTASFPAPKLARVF